MAEASTQKSRLWLWIGAGILLVVIFFVVRSMAKDRMPVHATAATRNRISKTVPTNGLVEPVRNYPFNAPIATSVRAIDVQQGDKVKQGQLIMQLDDISARARVASAESALRSAEATLEATREGGTPVSYTHLTLPTILLV